MVDERVEATLFPLLEEHSFDEVLQALRSYVDTQVQLAQMLRQDAAFSDWQHQAAALEMANAVIQGKELVTDGF